MLSVSFERDMPMWVKSDPAVLRQILINLVGNAVKFTFSGSIKILVESMQIRSKMAGLRFSIIDTGIGISDADATYLFEPFSQGDNSTTRRFGGTGLGLVLSRDLSRVLGGKNFASR